MRRKLKQLQQQNDTRTPFKLSSLIETGSNKKHLKNDSEDTIIQQNGYKSSATLKRAMNYKIQQKKNGLNPHIKFGSLHDLLSPVADTTLKELKQIKNKLKGKYIKSAFNINEQPDFDIQFLASPKQQQQQQQVLQLQYNKKKQHNPARFTFNLNKQQQQCSSNIRRNNSNQYILLQKQYAESNNNNNDNYIKELINDKLKKSQFLLENNKFKINSKTKEEFTQQQKLIILQKSENHIIHTHNNNNNSNTLESPKRISIDCGLIKYDASPPTFNQTPFSKLQLYIPKADLEDQLNIMSPHKKKQNQLNQQKETSNFNNSRPQQDQLIAQYTNGEAKTDVNANKLTSTHKFRRTIPEIMRSLKEALVYLKKLNLNPKELITTKVFSNKPFEKDGSTQFISAVKAQDKMAVIECLMQNKYLVYDFDYVYMTGLHWAVKRGNLDITAILIKYGADVNGKDIIGRTPLHFAVKHGHLEIVQVLKFQIYPMVKCSKQLQVNESKKLKNNKLFIKKSLILSMTPISQREEVWNREINMMNIDKEIIQGIK